MSKVAVLRTSPETVVQDYGRLMDLAGYRQTLPFSAQTCLRINISWHVYMPACSTTPWQMHGVIEKLKSDGYDVSKDLIAAQNDTVVVSCREGTVRNHLAPVLEHYDVPIQYLSEPPTEWVRYEPKGKMLVLDRVFEKQGIQIPKMLIGKNVIHMPTVKTHIFTGTTGSMKNAFGGLLNLNRHWTHSVIHETLVDLLRIQKEIHPGVFAVMDGTIVGDSIEGVNFGFRGSLNENTLASRGQKLIYWGPLKFMENLLLRSPIVPWSYFASRLYHDGFWYPVNGKPRVENILQTSWGKLFNEYGASGSNVFA